MTPERVDKYWDGEVLHMGKLVKVDYTGFTLDQAKMAIIVKYGHYEIVLEKPVLLVRVR